MDLDLMRDFIFKTEKSTKTESKHKQHSVCVSVCARKGRIYEMPENKFQLKNKNFTFNQLAFH